MRRRELLFSCDAGHVAAVLRRRAVWSDYALVYVCVCACVMARASRCTSPTLRPCDRATLLAPLIVFSAAIKL